MSSNKISSKNTETENTDLSAKIAQLESKYNILKIEKRQCEEETRKLQACLDFKIKEIENKYESKIKENAGQNEREILNLKKENDKKLSEQNEQNKQKNKDLKHIHKKEIEEMKLQHNSEIKKLEENQKKDMLVAKNKYKNKLGIKKEKYKVKSMNSKQEILCLNTQINSLKEQIADAMVITQIIPFGSKSADKEKDMPITASKEVGIDNIPVKNASTDVSTQKSDVQNPINAAAPTVSKN